MKKYISIFSVTMFLAFIVFSPAIFAEELHDLMIHPSLFGIGTQEDNNIHVQLVVVDLYGNETLPGVTIPIELSVNGKTDQHDPIAPMNELGLVYDINLTEYGINFVDNKTYTFLFKADPLNQIAEDDESNNTYSTTMKMESGSTDYDIVEETIEYFVDELGTPMLKVVVEDLTKRSNAGLSLPLQINASGRTEIFFADIPLNQSNYKMQYLLDLTSVGLELDNNTHFIELIVDPMELYTDIDRTNNIHQTVLILNESYLDPVLIKHPDSPNVYIVSPNNTRHFIPTESVFYSWGYEWTEVKTIGDLSTFPMGEALKYRDGTLIKGTEAPVYVVTDNGLRTWITSEEVFLGLGYKWSDIIVIPDSEISLYPKFEEWTQTNKHPNGTLLLHKGIYYLVEDGYSRQFLSEDAFENRGYKYEHVISVNSIIEYPVGASIL
ncbi:MAG TPA: hypothetical protein VJA22_03215 [Patescibacteria group bacterium]|nr:hypothetical protein [Patescibacteria group bacterium]